MRVHLSHLFQTGASLQQKADGWKDKVNENRGSRTHLEQEAQVPHYVLSRSLKNGNICQNQSEPVRCLYWLHMLHQHLHGAMVTG